MSPVGFSDDFFKERFKPEKPVFDEATLKKLHRGSVFSSRNVELRNLRFSSYMKFKSSKTKLGYVLYRSHFIFSTLGSSRFRFDSLTSP